MLEDKHVRDTAKEYNYASVPENSQFKLENHNRREGMIKVWRKIIEMIKLSQLQGVKKENRGPRKNDLIN